MSVSLDSQSHHRLEDLNHQEARRAFHGNFMDSLSVRTTGIRVVQIVIFLILTLCCIVGCFVYVVILMENHNYHAASWAFLTAAISTGTSTLFILHLRSTLELWHDRGTLEGMKIFAMIMSLFSGLAVSMYLVYGILDKPKFSLEGYNDFSSTVFSGMCLFMSIFLYFSAQWYQNMLQLAQATRAIGMQYVVSPGLEATV